MEKRKRPNAARAAAAAVFLLLFIGGVNGGVKKCAYSHHEVVKEMSAKSADEESERVMEKDDSSKSSSSSSSSTTNTILQGIVLADNQTMQCTKASDFCYSLWMESPNNKSNITVLVQGCWESSGEYDCRRQSECVADNRPMKAMNNTKFCCCSGDMCNMNMTESDIPMASEEPETGQQVPPYQPASHRTDTLIITLVSVLSIVFGCVLVFIVYRRWATEHKPSPDSVHLMEAAPAPSPTLDMENLKLHELVGRGRYGCVWRGTLNDYEVAVKVFVHQHRQYFLNERDIYTLPFMEHPSLMKFIGGDQRPSAADSSRLEYYLVMGHAPFGCLQDYLRANTVDWVTLCRMTQGVAKGLAHLHTDVRRGDKVKPCISHRDINSRNVLVKVDLSCAICDMGFAMKIAGSKYYGQNGEEQHAETTSLTDVGTLRYMAPEVLEGAVNLRDCESSLKQIDVYALGLVIWEVATRCTDLYQGLDVPDYKLPFEVEIGLHPTFEQMQVLVSRNKARPLFPEVWKDTNLAVRLLKETIEDCWDQDAEARLTSLCVEERLQELPILWERHKANIGISGVSPTVNPTFPPSSNRQSSHGGGVSSMTDASGGSELTDRNANIMGVVSLADTANAAGLLASRANVAASNYQRFNYNRESSASENTVETTVTTSPSETLIEPVHSQGKNCINNQAFPWLPMPLQPHQGRNPCLERNMIMEPLEEVSVSGNTLLEKGSHHKGPIRNRDVTGNGTGGSNNEVGDLFDALHLVDNMESNSLVNHDVLGQSSRNYHPIPYLQNAVHNSLPVVHCTTFHCPKQPNVPGNGQHSAPPPTAPKAAQQKRGTFASRFERKKASCSGGNKRGKEWSGIRSLLDWTRLTKSTGSGGEEDVDNISKPSFGNGVVTAQRAMSDSTLNTEKSNLTVQQQQDGVNFLGNHKVQTEVCLMNGAGVSHEVNRAKPIVRLTNGHGPNGTYRAAELGVAKLQVQHGQAPVIKMRSGSQSEVTTSSASSSREEISSSSETRLQRPNTLSLVGHNFHRLSGSTDGEDSTSLGDINVNSVSGCEKRDVSVNALKHGTKQKIEQRVKTPFHMKPGRFSLYDDRMMSSWHAGDGSHVEVNKSKFSASVPTDINSLCAVQAEDFVRENQSKYNRTMLDSSTDIIVQNPSPPPPSITIDGTSTSSTVQKLNSSASSPSNLKINNGGIQRKLNNHATSSAAIVEPVLCHVSCM